jgi:hypothetical protein
MVVLHAAPATPGKGRAHEQMDADSEDIAAPVEHVIAKQSRLHQRSE